MVLYCVSFIKTCSVRAVLLASVLAGLLSVLLFLRFLFGIALRAGYERVFILFCNICMYSYFGWYFLCCTSQAPTVSQCGYAGAEALSVGRISGSAGPQFSNCARGPFGGPRDPEGSSVLTNCTKP